MVGKKEKRNNNHMDKKKNRMGDLKPIILITVLKTNDLINTPMNTNELSNPMICCLQEATLNIKIQIGYKD